jgi:hypothetical protein
VNKKQCPTCGEENPPEAVMCWACYTPLSGSAAGGSIPAGASRNAPSATSEGEEKKAIPPWQLAVIGIGLLLAIGTGIKSMMPASTEAPMDDLPAVTNNPTEAGAPAPAAAPAAVVSAAPGGGVSVTPTEAPFKIVVPPNPRVSVGTLAIVPTDKNASGPMAASYAAYARRQYASQNNRWTTLYIYVFSDDKSAQDFAEVMKKRRGVALSSDDMSRLSSLWGAAIARYEYSAVNGRRVERVLYPSKNPSGWWR